MTVVLAGRALVNIGTAVPITRVTRATCAVEPFFGVSAHRIVAAVVGARQAFVDAWASRIADRPVPGESGMAGAVEPPDGVGAVGVDIAVVCPKGALVNVIARCHAVTGEPDPTGAVEATRCVDAGGVGKAVVCAQLALVHVCTCGAIPSKPAVARAVKSSDRVGALGIAVAPADKRNALVHVVTVCAVSSVSNVTRAVEPPSSVGALGIGVTPADAKLAFVHICVQAGIGARGELFVLQNRRAFMRTLNFKLHDIFCTVAIVTNTSTSHGG